MLSTFGLEVTAAVKTTTVTAMVTSGVFTLCLLEAHPSKESFRGTESDAELQWLLPTPAALTPTR